MKIIQMFITTIFAATSLQANAEVVYSGKKITTLYGFYDSADCIYFKLEGVTQADPIKPNESLFAISRTQPGAKEAFATLLTAKITRTAPWVRTRGNLVCGYAGVAEVILE
jgi:hypothetical protein